MRSLTASVMCIAHVVGVAKLTRLLAVAAEPLQELRGEFHVAVVLHQAVADRRGDDVPLEAIRVFRNQDSKSELAEPS